MKLSHLTWSVWGEPLLRKILNTRSVYEVVVHFHLYISILFTLIYSVSFNNPVNFSVYLRTMIRYPTLLNNATFTM